MTRRFSTPGELVRRSCWRAHWAASPMRPMREAAWCPRMMPSASVAGSARDHRLARIEAANLPMVAVTSWLKLDLDAARREERMRSSWPTRIGHPRGALIARHAAWFSALLAADHTEAEVQARETEILTARVGSPRFQAEYLMGLGEAQMLRGDRSGAARFAEEALDTVVATAPGFLGPAIYGLIARSAPDASSRSGAIREAERCCGQARSATTTYLFGRYATEAAISAGDWREAARLAGSSNGMRRASRAVGRVLRSTDQSSRRHARAADIDGLRQALAELRADATASASTAYLPTLDAAVVSRGERAP